MNMLFFGALGLITIWFGAITVSAGQHQTFPSGEIEHASPFACNAFALSAEVRKRHFDELGPALLKLKKATRELADGYEFEFPAENHTYQLLTERMFQERLCCPFFNIELRLEGGAGPLWLPLTGQPGIKEFIKTDAPAWVDS
jgi:hypothetical protein